jgi:hypothetical protein
MRKMIEECISAISIQTKSNSTGARNTAIIHENHFGKRGKADAAAIRQGEQLFLGFVNAQSA